jgi:NTP pyrophosphatase (non-canonical NTP hydrolase)
MLLVSEVCEALEEYRSGRGLNETYYTPYTNEDDGGVHQKPEGIPIELADVVIRLFYMAHIYGIDLEAAIRVKVEFNKNRSYKHGGKVI